MAAEFDAVGELFIEEAPWESVSDALVDFRELRAVFRERADKGERDSRMRVDEDEADDAPDGQPSGRTVTVTLLSAEAAAKVYADLKLVLPKRVKLSRWRAGWPQPALVEHSPDSRAVVLRAALRASGMAATDALKASAAAKDGAPAKVSAAAKDRSGATACAAA